MNAPRHLAVSISQITKRKWPAELVLTGHLRCFLTGVYLAMKVDFSPFTNTK